MRGGVTPRATVTPASPAAGRPSGLACVIAFGVVAPLLASALASPLPFPLLAGAALFLFLAIAHDVHQQRIPNWITAPAFGAAVAFGAWVGGTDGALHALLGAGAAFALLVLPYSVGAVGAGDVKAAMVLGAAFGAASVAVLALIALALGGTFAAVRIAMREGPAPAARSASDGIPFAMTLTLALAAQQLANLL
jgi:prepilin peptidase CpaA